MQTARESVIAVKAEIWYGSIWYLCPADVLRQAAFESNRSG